MVRIRHLVWALVGFDVVMGLAFVAGKAAADSALVTCCIAAKADNKLPPKGDCLLSDDGKQCLDGAGFFGKTTCAGVFTGKAIPASYSSTNSGEAEGCVLVDGAIGVMQLSRKCVLQSGCMCMDGMATEVPVDTKVASGLVCPVKK